MNEVIAALLNAYFGKDEDCPHQFEIDAIEQALVHVEGHIHPNLLKNYQDWVAQNKK